MKKIKQFFANLWNKIKSSKFFKVLTAIILAIGAVLFTIFIVVMKTKNIFSFNTKAQKEYDKEVDKVKEKNQVIKDKAKKVSDKSKKVMKENGVDVKSIVNKQNEIDKGVKKYYQVIDTSKDKE